MDHIETINRIYKRQKFYLLKFFLLAVIGIIVMFGIFCFVLGPALPYTTIDPTAGIVEHNGWIQDDFMYLIICIALGFWVPAVYTVVAVSIASSQYGKLGRILLFDCDPETFLKINRYGIEYAEQVRKNRLQGIFLRLLQTGYIYSLTILGNDMEARKYLKEICTNKRLLRYFRYYMIYMQLIEAIKTQDAESYKAALMQMKKAFYISFMFVGSKEYFQAIGEYLQRRYDTTVQILVSYKPLYPFYKVQSSYLLAHCYLQLDQKEKAEECMKYIAEHGNTLPIQEQALKYLERGMDMCCKTEERSDY